MDVTLQSIDDRQIKAPSSSRKLKRDEQHYDTEEALDDDDVGTKQSGSLTNEGASATADASSSKKSGSVMSKAREVRLEQNRKAARESRRRKKVMVEELQRSVIIFSRTNGTLKAQNEELQRLLLTAQAQIIALDSGQHMNAKGGRVSLSITDSDTGKSDKESVASDTAAIHALTMNPNLAMAQLHAQQLATYAQQQATAQALYESQGFPPVVARTAAQSLLSSSSPAVLASVLAAHRNAEMPMNGSTAAHPHSMAMIPQWPPLFPTMSFNGMMGSSGPMNNNPQTLQDTLNLLYGACFSSPHE